MDKPSMKQKSVVDYVIIIKKQKSTIQSTDVRVQTNRMRLGPFFVFTGGKILFYK